MSFASHTLLKAPWPSTRTRRNESDALFKTWPDSEAINGRSDSDDDGGLGSGGTWKKDLRLGSLSGVGVGISDGVGEGIARFSTSGEAVYASAYAGAA